jgi:hypothetical protein
VPDQLNTVGEVLFRLILFQKVQIHFRNVGRCVIDMDDQLSIGSTDLSLMTFRQWNKYIGNIMVAVEFDIL